MEYGSSNRSVIPHQLCKEPTLNHENPR